MCRRLLAAARCNTDERRRSEPLREPNRFDVLSTTAIFVTSVFKSLYMPVHRGLPILTIPETLANAPTNRGSTLAALSDERPVLLLFLRQFG
jgi:hypothetical protein